MDARAGEDEALAGGRSVSTIPRPADEAPEARCSLCPLPHVRLRRLPDHVVGVTITTEAGRLGVNTGYADDVTCPMCGDTYDVLDYFTLTVDGTSVCPFCLDKTESGMPDVIAALNALGIALWSARENGADPLTMGNLCMLGRTASDHLATKYMPDLDDVASPPPVDLAGGGRDG